MPELKVSKHIHAPVDRVFDVMSDFASAPARISAISRVEMLTDGPTRVGTRFRETRVMFGKEATETMEVLEFEPNRSYTLGAHSCGCEYRCNLMFRPVGPGTEVTMHFKARPTSFMAKLISPLTMLMMGTLKKSVAQDLEDAKKFAESNP